MTLTVAAEALASGAVIVIPTDTVYGVAVSAELPGAAARLAEAKGRPADQAVAVLVADAEQAETLADFDRLPARSPDAVRALAGKVWPGAVTLVLPRADRAAGLALGGNAATVGLRCPDHPWVRALARRTGPVAATSANAHGEPTPATAAEAAAALAREPALVVDGGRLALTASAVLDLCVAPPAVLRPGPFTDSELTEILG